MASLSLMLTAGPGAEFTPVDAYPAIIPVTCKLAYYAEFNKNANSRGHLDDIRLAVADPPPTNSTTMRVQGVVMNVITPKPFAGRTICFYLEGPPVQVGDVRCPKRGVVYRAYVLKDHIGTLTFREPGGNIKPVAEPKGPTNGSQPTGSVTNRALPEAGSRR